MKHLLVHKVDQLKLIGTAYDRVVMLTIVEANSFISCTFETFWCWKPN